MNHSIGSPRPTSIAVTGATGQLGTQLCRCLGPGVIPLTPSELDLTNPTQIRQVVRQLQPDVLINTAAYTNVDRAEVEPDLCWQINHHAVIHLATVTAETGCRFVQISTDYVFGKPSRSAPFREHDAVAPVGVYARSKAASEDAARRHPQHLIVRTCGIYGPDCPSKSRNFVSAMIQQAKSRSTLEVVNDQVCNPTYVKELAAAIEYLVARCEQGTFHVVNQQALSWYDFAVEIFRILQTDTRIIPIETSQFTMNDETTAPRPAYSALDTTRYHQLGGPSMSTCRTALRNFLEHSSVHIGSNG